MRVLVSGSTGLVGTELVEQLTSHGHQPVRLLRGPATDGVDHFRWDPSKGDLDPGAVESVDAVVHLAGESIASRRWTKAQKQRILQSRVTGTTLLADAVASAGEPPSVFLSGSAIGFYGNRGDERLTEQSPPGQGFAAEVCIAWEAATNTISTDSTRVTHLRTGIVLDANRGALAEQLPFFRLGLGGRIGSGQQWFSWISLADEVAAILHLLDADIEGPANLTAPSPVTNAEFTAALGGALKRPTAIPTPKLALWAKLGRELSQTLLEGGAHVSPVVLAEDGFVFGDQLVDDALRRILGSTD